MENIVTKILEDLLSNKVTQGKAYELLIEAEKSWNKKVLNLKAGNDALKEEIKTLKRIKFVNFNEDECWIYQGNNEDYLESLVCPVVISPEELLNIIEISDGWRTIFNEYVSLTSKKGK